MALNDTRGVSASLVRRLERSRVVVYISAQKQVSPLLTGLAVE
jgi:hypothetical protein